MTASRAERVSPRGEVKPRPCILRDTREQNPLDRWFTPAVTVQVASIGTGDYTVAGYSSQIAIERKSLPDLVHCCGADRERFMDQMRRMRDYRVKVLVVEALEEAVWAGAYRSSIDCKSVIGAVRAIAMDYGVSTFWCGNPKGAAQLVEWMALRMVRKFTCEELGLTGDRKAG